MKLPQLKIPSDYKILDFIKDKKTNLVSSPRVLALLVLLGTIADWMTAVFTEGRWEPTWESVGMVLGTLGFQVSQKFAQRE